MNRRTFNSGFLSAAVALRSGRAAAADNTVFYEGVGDRLTRWDIDVDTVTFMRP
jgi:hypothetical protein